MKNGSESSEGGKPVRRVIKPGSKLSVSEERILKLISLGNSTKQIAFALELSPKTVENHRGNICKKLGITGTASLLRYAMKNGVKSDSN